MNLRNFVIGMLSTLMAWGQTASGPVQIRAYYHNPIKPFAELFVADAGGAIQPLKLVAEGLSAPQITAPVNGNIVLYTQQNVDSKKTCRISCCQRGLTCGHETCCLDHSTRRY